MVTGHHIIVNDNVIVGRAADGDGGPHQLIARTGF
jgi:hypothetical protein